MSEREVKYCVYCGANIKKNQIYCPNCGKLVIKPKEKIEISKPSQTYLSPRPKAQEEYTRQCSKCGSIITSNVLEQCPICMTYLEKIPEYFKQSQEISLVYKDVSYKESYLGKRKHRGKLVPEKSIKISKDQWNVKEGVNVFTRSLMYYLFIQLIILFGFAFQIGADETLTVELDMTIILLSQIPGIIFGIVPLWYIFSSNHNPKKLGFSSNKIVLGLIFGILGGIVLLFLNYFSNLLNTLLADAGFSLFDVRAYIEEETQIIKGADILMILLLGILLCFNAISVEILFRGVLHNTLRENEGNPRSAITVILLVALIYAGINLILSFPSGLQYFLLNFLGSVLLGSLYEINKNIYTSIIANVCYSILILTVIIIL